MTTTRRDSHLRAALIATVFAASAATLPATAAKPDTSAESREAQPATPDSRATTHEPPSASAAADATTHEPPPASATADATTHEPPPASTAADATTHEPPPASATADATAHEPPLIAYALELGQSDSRSAIRDQYLATKNLHAVTFEMSRHPPPSDADCSHMLGASRFAQQYARLATIQDQLGNFQAVIDANKSALACAPRVATYEAAIASTHITLDQLDEARAAAERGHAIDPEDVDIRDVRARLDFIEEHWADATARFRLQVLEEKYAGSPMADYARCYLWLAQRRAGVHDPELPKTPVATVTTEPPRKHWPEQILDTLRGEQTEEELAQVIRDTSDRQRREWLTEALFYVGELRLAQGDTETARRHFATVVNLKVLNFVEYGMARAELKKMRDRHPVADAATAGASTRAR